jgi:hypothetical protein
MLLIKGARGTQVVRTLRGKMRFNCTGELDILPRRLIGRKVRDLCIDDIIVCATPCLGHA